MGAPFFSWKPLRPVGVLDAVGDRDDREDEERRDLDDVDRDVDAGRPRDPAEGDVGDAEREDDAEEVHEEGAVEAAAERVREELVQEVAAQQRGHADHAARVNPVVEVARPAGDELRHACELVRLGLRQEGLLGEEVRRAGSRVELGELGVAHRRGQAEQQGGEDAEPHGAAGHRGAVERLDLKGEPKERAGRDQGHCVDGQTG